MCLKKIKLLVAECLDQIEQTNQGNKKSIININYNNNHVTVTISQHIQNPGIFND